MNEPNHHPEPESTLGRLFEPDQGGLGRWEPAEFRAILDHQLTADLEHELVTAGLIDQHQQHAPTTPTAATSTIGSLLRSPAPPLATLRLVKELARGQRLAAEKGRPGPPVEVAAALYFAAIACALSRCDQRITSLGDADLHEGFTWCRDRQWLPAELTSLFNDALHRLPHP